MNKQGKRRANISAHPYVPHLLEDIKAAHRGEESYGFDFAPETIEEELEMIERWVAGEFDNPAHTFGYYCGLKPENFPPPEQLSDRDVEMICAAFNKLLFSWNASIDLPDAMPDRLKYTFMVNTLSEGFTLVNTGIVGFDYCTGYAPDCPFGEYCPCLEIWKDEGEEE